MRAGKGKLSTTASNNKESLITPPTCRGRCRPFLPTEGVQETKINIYFLLAMKRK